MRILTYFILLLLVLLGITFAALNAEVVSIHYYLGTRALPLSLLLAIAFIGGGFLGLLVCAIISIRLKNTNRRLRQRLKLLEEEVINLRAIPLKDEH